MQWTTEAYEALKDAIQSGTRRVKYTDKEIEYRSLAEMRALLRDAEKALGLVKQSQMRTVATVSKGLK
jgi:hypothetical protein